jgi:hypothetical protein
MRYQQHKILKKILDVIDAAHFFWFVWQRFSVVVCWLRDSENGQQEHFLLLAIFVFCTKKEMNYNNDRLHCITHKAT